MDHTHTVAQAEQQASLVGVGGVPPAAVQQRPSDQQDAPLTGGGGGGPAAGHETVAGGGGYGPYSGPSGAAAAAGARQLVVLKLRFASPWRPVPARSDDVVPAEPRAPKCPPVAVSAPVPSLILLLLLLLLELCVCCLRLRPHTRCVATTLSRTRRAAAGPQAGSDGATAPADVGQVHAVHVQDQDVQAHG